MNNNNSVRREFRMFFSLFVAKVNFAFDGAMRHNLDSILARSLLIGLRTLN